VISAIAIATKNAAAVPAPSPKPLLEVTAKATKNSVEVKDWLSTGDTAFLDDQVAFSTLPPDLYGAQWLKQNRKYSEEISWRTTQNADVFVAIDSLKEAKQEWLRGFSKTPTGVQLNDGTFYAVWKKRVEAGESFSYEGNLNVLVMANPATTMEPAFDLKPVTSYKAVAAKLSGPGLLKSKIDGKDRVLFKQASAENKITWSIEVGVGDIYSLTISYNNPAAGIINGHLQLLAGDGTLMKEEDVELTPTRPGKSNYITTTTGSMINAGSYQVVFTAKGAEGVTLNALDVQ